MGETAGDEPLAASLLHRAGGLRQHRLVKLLEALPGDRALEGLRQHAHGDERVSQVGRAQEGVPPAGARLVAALGCAIPCASVIPATSERELEPVPDVVMGGLEAEHQQGVGAVAGTRQCGLAGIDEAAIRRVKPCLG